MDLSQMKKLADLREQNLAGWIYCKVSYLALGHSGTGDFPAIKKEDGKEIVVLERDKDLLELVRQHLPDAYCVVRTFSALVHASGLAFRLDRDGDEAEAVNVFPRHMIIDLCRKENSMCWTPGLIQLRTPEQKVEVFS